MRRQRRFAPAPPKLDSKHRVRYAGFGASVGRVFDPQSDEFQEWVPPTPRAKVHVTHLDRFGDPPTGSMYCDRADRLVFETEEVSEYLSPELGVNVWRAFLEDSSMPVT